VTVARRDSDALPSPDRQDIAAESLKDLSFNSSTPLTAMMGGHRTKVFTRVIAFPKGPSVGIGCRASHQRKSRALARSKIGYKGATPLRRTRGGGHAYSAYRPRDLRDYARVFSRGTASGSHSSDKSLGSLRRATSYRKAGAKVATLDGGDMTRPRAADDFTVIRKRIEELRRESVSASAESQARPLAPQPYHPAGATGHTPETIPVNGQGPESWQSRCPR
jgi:hypothetical protein